MARLLVLLFSIWTCQVQPQMIRSPLSMLNRPITEALLDPRNYIEAPRAFAEVPRNYIEVPVEPSRNYVPRIVDAPRGYIPQQPGVIEQPCNPILPISNPPVIPFPNVPAPSTTIITDCTPSVCKNLANTINLMIVSGLLQNTKGGDGVALQLATPLLKEIIANPGVALGTSNSVANLLNLNFAAPNMIGSGLVSPSLVAPNYIPSNLIAPTLIAPTPNPIAASNPPVPINKSAMLSNLLKLLGGAI